MTDKIKLSNRLKIIASFLPEHAFFADIGTDHAFLPSFVCLQDDKAKAIAGEVSEGPYKAAIKTVESYHLSEAIDVRLGNGLEVIGNDPVTELVIAGMGGALITKILEDGKKYLLTVKRIIVQPNIGEIYVREWFGKNGYKITNEAILSENSHIYEVIVAEKDEESYESPLSEAELLFGPVHLQRKSSLFYKKWQKQQQKLEQILHNIKGATHQDDTKITQLTKKLSLIEEVLFE